MSKLKCKRCNHEWFKRREIDPKVCPKCCSIHWNSDQQPRIGRPIPVKPAKK